jgi:hypothetical protein
VRAHRSQQEQFAKQKFNFIELETKQFFRDFVVRENIEDATPNEAGE